MRYIVTTVVGAVLAGAIVATASRFEWANYDPTKSVKLSGTVRTAENIDGFVVIRIKTEREHQPSTTWVVVLGSPKELKEAGLALELRLDIPVEATVWE